MADTGPVACRVLSASETVNRGEFLTVRLESEAEVRLELRDKAQAVVPGVTQRHFTTGSGWVVAFTPDGLLDPNEEYDLSVEGCGERVVFPVRTSDGGLPLEGELATTFGYEGYWEPWSGSSVTALMVRGFAIDVEPGQVCVFGVDQAEEWECGAPVCTGWDGSPRVRMEAPLLYLKSGGVMALHDVVIEFDIEPGGKWVEGVELFGVVDMGLYEAGLPDACDSLAEMGLACEPCEWSEAGCVEIHALAARIDGNSSMVVPTECGEECLVCFE